MTDKYDSLYAGNSPADAITLLDSRNYGQLSHWNTDSGRPEMAFMHYAVHAEDDAIHAEGPQIWGHFANGNPMLGLLQADPNATFWVEGPSSYVPSHWYTSNRDKAVPTSYYSWAQFEVEVEIVRDSEGTLAILESMLARLQSEGEHPPMDPALKFWQGMLGAITGLKMNIKSARSRHKYGQNRPADARQTIAEQLRQRGQGQDAAVARQVLARI